MNTWKQSCSASAVLLSLAACAGYSGYSPTPYWTIHTPAFANLKPGVTTKAEVRRQVGVPLTEMTFQRQNEEVWEYGYVDGTTIRMVAYVHFEPGGVLKYTEHFLDPAFQGGMSK